MKKNLLITTSLSFFLLSSITSDEGFTSELRREKEIAENSSSVLRQSSSPNWVHTHNFSELMQALKAPLGSSLQEKIMPASLLRNASIDLEMLRNTTGALNEQEKVGIFRQSVFNGILGIKIFYEFTREIPDESPSFFEALKAACINDEEKKGLTEISKKDQNVESLIKRSLISVFLRIPAKEKEQDITIALLNTAITEFKEGIEKAFRLQPSQQIFDPGKLKSNFNLLEFALSFGIPHKAMTGSSDDMYALGNSLYSSGRIGAAEKWYREAARKNHLEATAIFGTLLAQQGKAQEAESLLREAAEKGSIQAIATLGTLLAQQGKAQEAELWLREAVRKKFPQAKFNLGVFLYEQIEKKENLRTLKETLKLKRELKHLFEEDARKGHVLAMHRLGGLLCEIKESGAREWIEKAAKAGEPEAIHNLGALLAKQGMREKDEAKAKELFTQARAHLEKAVQQRVRDAGVSLGHFLYMQGKQEKDEAKAKELFTQARERCEESLKIDNNNARAMRVLALLLKKQGMREKDEAKAKEWFDQAREQYKRILTIEKDNSEVMHDLALLLKKQGMREKDDVKAKELFTQAIQWCERSLKIDKHNFSIMNEIGIILEQQRRREKDEAKARELLTRSRERYEKAAKGGYAAAINNLGNCLCMQGKQEKDEAKAKKLFTQARKQYERSLTIDNDNFSTTHNLARLLEELGMREKDEAKAKEWFDQAGAQYEKLGAQYEKAGVQYEKAARGELLLAITNLGNFLYRQGAKETDKAKAKAWLEKAASAKYPRAMNALGYVLCKENNLDGAEKLFREAATNDFPAGWLSVANILPNNRTDEKHELYQKAIKLGVAGAEIFYAAFLKEQGDHEQALKFLNFYDVQRNYKTEEDHASSSDEDSNEKSSSPTFEGCSKEDLREEEKNPVASSSADSVTTTEAVSEKEKVSLSKRLQKLYERQKRKEEAEAMKTVSVSNLRKLETPKSYQDVTVFAPSSLHAEIKNNIKIQCLVSCLASGEGSRANFEKLKNYDDLFSMRLTKKDRFVFRILKGDVKNGVKSLQIFSTEEHYRLEAGKSEKVSWKEN